MKTILFATGNKGKVASLKGHFKNYGLDVLVEQCALDIIEPQADTATEVALSKAHQAYDILKKPVVVDDSSFHINALGGFPGPYIKYMLSSIGIDGILQFLKPHKDRSAYFLSTLVYIDENGKEHIFEDGKICGEITKKVIGKDNPNAWSELHKIFIPTGKTIVLAEMPDSERRSLNDKNNSYARFAEWLKDNL